MEQNKSQLPPKKAFTEIKTTAFEDGILELLESLHRKINCIQDSLDLMLEVNFTVRWDPHLCSPRETQLQVDIRIWRTRTDQGLRSIQTSSNGELEAKPSVSSSAESTPVESINPFVAISK